MTTTKTELQVKALQNGTVIDHIPSENLFKVVALLKLETLDNQITVGNNLNSKLLGSKGIIKIADKYFAEGRNQPHRPHRPERQDQRDQRLRGD